MKATKPEDVPANKSNVIWIEEDPDQEVTCWKPPHQPRTQAELDRLCENWTAVNDRLKKFIRGKAPWRVTAIVSIQPSAGHVDEYWVRYRVSHCPGCHDVIILRGDLEMLL